MAEIPQFLETAAFGALNEILAGFRDQNGYAHPNRFEVLIFPPSKLSGATQLNIFQGLERRGGKEDIRKISLRAQDVNLPGRNLSTTNDANIYGPQREVVEGVTYAEEITVNFQASSELSERVFFENWQRSAFDEKTWNIGYYNDYIGAMEIYLLDRQSKRRYGVKLWEVFPKTIAANALSYGDNDTILLTPVNFSFRYWTSLDKIQNPDLNIFDRVLETTINAAERNITRNIPRILNRL